MEILQQFQIESKWAEFTVKKIKIKLLFDGDIFR